VADVYERAANIRRDKRTVSVPFIVIW